MRQLLRKHAMSPKIWVLACATVVAALGGAASAALIGVGSLNEIATPFTVYDNLGPFAGATSYDSSTRVLTVTAFPHTIDFTGGGLGVKSYLSGATMTINIKV